jgi:hypothetical protein
MRVEVQLADVRKDPLQIYVDKVHSPTAIWRFQSLRFEIREEATTLAASQAWSVGRVVDAIASMAAVRHDASDSPEKVRQSEALA